MTVAQIAAAVELEGWLLENARRRKLPQRAEHRREIELLEARIILMMNSKPSNVVNISDYRRVS